MAQGATRDHLLLFSVWLLFNYRPQQKQQKEHEEMLKSLKKGDKILTHGGLHADVVKGERIGIKVRLNETTIVKTR